MKQKSRRVQYLVTLCVSLAFVVLGATTAWPSPVKNKFLEADIQIHVTEEEFSWMLSMSSIGTTLGSLSSSYVTDYLGRRMSILGSALPLFIGTLIVVFAKKAWLLYITVFSWNFGIGMLESVSGMYLAEIIDRDIRGTLTVATKIMFNLGHLLVMAIGPRISYETLNYCLLILPLGYFLVCWWIPESPYYYLKEGNDRMARRALLQIRIGISDQELEEELTSKRADVKKEVTNTGYFKLLKELFTAKQYRRPVIIAFGLKMTQICTGCLTVLHYIGTILRETSVPKSQHSNVFLVIGLTTFIVGIISSFLVDRVGRRPLLIYSYFGTGACLGAAGIYFFLLEVIRPEATSMSSYIYVPIIAIVLSNIISSLGFSSIVGLITAEIFPLDVKTIAIVFAKIFGGFLGFTVSKSFIFIKDNLGTYTLFWLYTSASIVGGLLSYFVVVETKGKTLREIQILLNGSEIDIEESIHLNQHNNKNVNDKTDQVDVELNVINRNSD